MFKNQLKIAVRNAFRYKRNSLINIAGLSLGLASVLLITLYITDELHYDEFIKDTDRIYRVNIDAKMGADEFFAGYTPPPAGRTLVENYPEIEAYTRLYRPSTDVVEYSEGGTKNVFNESEVFGVDPNFLEVLTYPLEKGNPKTCLTNPNSIVITRVIAKKYFGNTDPIGKTLYYGSDRKPLQVTGILADMKNLSASVKFDMLIPVENFGNVTYFDWSWVWLNMATYVKLTEKAVTDPNTVVNLEAQFPNLVKTHAAGAFERIGQPFEAFLQKGNRWDLHLQSLPNIHLHSEGIESVITEQNSIKNLYIFGLIALLIIVLACVNFINLATAQSVKRSKEIGIRKVLGSFRIQLIRQFLTEAFLYTIVATLLSLVLVWAALPIFNEVSGKTISLAYIFDKGIWLFLVGLSLLSALLAGAYPAFYLTAFKPVQVLKGAQNTANPKNSFVRNGLVVFQFTVAITMIIATAIIYLQLRYAQNKDLGYEKENIIVLQNTEKLGEQEETFRDELAALSEIKSASISSSILTKGTFADFYVPQISSENEDIAKDIILESYMVDDQFISTLNFELAAGRGFAKNFNDSLSVVINEAMVKQMGWQNPIGKHIRYTSGRNETYSVIGVIKDFNLQSLHTAIRPFALFSDRSKSYDNGMSFITLKIQAGNPRKILETLQNKWNSYQPNVPFEYSFLDEDLNTAYISEERQATLFGVFAFLAIFIACIGLLGLIAFMAQQKAKEIGIRKVLGANILEILQLLAIDFVKLIVIALLIASPFAVYFMNNWLQDFAYRISIPWWVFAGAGLASLIIALTTVSYQAIRAARQNPVKSLRME
ncbi:ABC transporter permease [Flagellimonas eckloniae]|uniref:ABC transporter permease n=1 Tax=Flagellimonas eckloniae TaxID=346185 RepID=A0A0Q0WYZ4_9FLAO|nr:ABC transporter permease [Allomuricauda eckloniae]KQC30673.1 ABC transporter permease [Allomuricauda eckloniae]